MTRDHISINIINKNNYYEKDFFLLLRTNCIFLTSCNDEQELVTDNGHGHTVQTDYAERKCNTHDYQHSLLQDADYKAKFDTRVEKMKGLTQSRSAIDCDEAIVLPGAVHFQSISNPNEACLKT